MKPALRDVLLPVVRPERGACEVCAWVERGPLTGAPPRVTPPHPAFTAQYGDEVLWRCEACRGWLATPAAGRPGAPHRCGLVEVHLLLKESERGVERRLHREGKPFQATYDAHQRGYGLVLDELKTQGEYVVAEGVRLLESMAAAEGVTAEERTTSRADVGHVLSRYLMSSLASFHPALVAQVVAVLGAAEPELQETMVGSFDIGLYDLRGQTSRIAVLQGLVREHPRTQARQRMLWTLEGLAHPEVKWTHFATLGSGVSFESLEAHLPTLPGLLMLMAVAGFTTESFVDFEFRDHHFSADDADGDWDFQVWGDCPADVLHEVVEHLGAFSRGG